MGRPRLRPRLRGRPARELRAGGDARLQQSEGDGLSGALPHEGVHVRLGLSSIHGIGVFAIESIAEGTHLFESDNSGLVWIDKQALEEAAPSSEARRLYHDFGIARGGRIGCPSDFNNLTPGWYLNEPAEGEAPNVRVDPELNFFAARDIADGEELTVRYADFSEAG